MHRMKLVAPLALAAFLAGCTDAAKAPAEEAIKATEVKVGQLRVEAGKYAADQLKAIDAGLAAAKAAHAKGDFKGALAAAKELPGKAAALAAFVADRRNEEGRDYAMATAQVPQLLEGLRADLDSMAKLPKLPKGTTPAAVAEARAEAEALLKGLQASADKVSAGDLPGATAMARSVRERALALQARVQKLHGAPAPKVK